MAKYISTELANLIKARGYAQGALNRAEHRTTRLRLEVERLELVVIAQKVKLGTLDREISRLAPRIEPTQVRPRTKIRRPTWRYGAFNAALARLIRDAAGEVSTTDLAAKTARELGIPLTPVENYERHRERVRRQLSYWADRGFVDRLHDPRQQGEGRWQWRRYN